MAERMSYRARLREIAWDNYGYVTSQAAKEVGVPTVELSKLAARGGLQHIAYGLYRFSDIPTTPVDQFAEAVYRGGKDAYLYAESVLAMLELADINLRKILVATPHRTRQKIPPFMAFIRTPMPEQITYYEGLPSQPVAEALLACRGRVERERLKTAAEEARSRGLVTAARWDALREELSG